MQIDKACEQRLEQFERLVAELESGLELPSACEDPAAADIRWSGSTPMTAWWLKFL
jgi:hypothetical protein